MKMAFVGMFVLAALASAGPITINQPTARISSGLGSSLLGTVTASVVNQTSGNESLTATACFNGFCPGQAAPGLGPDFLVNDPLTIKLTDFTFSCGPGSSCGLSLGAFFTWFDVDLAGATVPVTLTVDGFAPNTIGLAFIAEVATCDMNGSNCGNAFSGLVGPTFTATAFTGTFNLGNLTLQGNTQAELDIVIGGLPAGNSVTMPGSLTVTFGTPVNSVPEPATASGMIIGLAALAWRVLRR